MIYGERRESYPSSISPEVASRLSVLQAALVELPDTSQQSTVESIGVINVPSSEQSPTATDAAPSADVIALTTAQMRSQLNSGVSEAFGSIAA